MGEMADRMKVRSAGIGRAEVFKDGEHIGNVIQDLVNGRWRAFNKEEVSIGLRNGYTTRKKAAEFVAKKAM